MNKKTFIYLQSNKTVTLTKSINDFRSSRIGNETFQKEKTLIKKYELDPTVPNIVLTKAELKCCDKITKYHSQKNGLQCFLVLSTHISLTLCYAFEIRK